MATPTETPPATTATEPEVAKDAKDATLTVDVAAATDKGDTKQPPESPKEAEDKKDEDAPKEVSERVKRARESAATLEEALKKDGDQAAEEPAAKKAAVEAEAEAEAAFAAEQAEARAAMAEAEEEEEERRAAEAKEVAVEEPPKEEAPPASMPPAVQRQMTTLSPEVAVAPPTLRREATVAA